MPYYLNLNQIKESSTTVFSCDYDLIIRNVQELNSLLLDNSTAANGSAKQIVAFKPNGVKFESSSSGGNDSIRLCLYANGISLYQGPFRPFADSLTRKFCIDIMDGYFPTELQSKYPDGVRFDLVDKRHVYYRQRQQNNSSVNGYRLGSGSLNTITNDEFKNIETQLIGIGSILLHKRNFFFFYYQSFKKNFSFFFVVVVKNSENPLTVEQFLHKLPNSVIRMEISSTFEMICQI